MRTVKPNEKTWCEHEEADGGHHVVGSRCPAGDGGACEPAGAPALPVFEAARPAAPPPGRSVKRRRRRR